MKTLISAMFALALVSGCAKDGAMGPMGPAGSPGTTMVKEYIGQITTSGSYYVNVPEIYGKRESTYIMAYWAFSSSPNKWNPMADGWLDSSSSHICSVSWTDAKVYFYQVTAGDWYMIQVFKHN